MTLPSRDQMILDAVAQIFVPEIDALKRRIEELEGGGIRYMGTFQRSVEYRRGTMITHDGSLWCAVTDTEPNQVPGSDSVWQLAVKRGQGARS